MSEGRSGPSNVTGLVPLELTAEERAEPERWVRRRKGAQDLAVRARVILACDAVADDGFAVSVTAVAEQAGVSVDTASKWRRRFLADRLECLRTSPARGRPRSVTDEQVADLITRTLETRPADATHWSTRSMAAKIGLSQSTASRVWRAFGLRPHRSGTFKLSTDPLFARQGP